ncbi:hypothetical protein ACFZB2_40935 [Streptomyces bobili]|uniref:hypothetical protein n=1 Tax=Streptomyces bobili TaxID=67280 RepID=UPI0036EE46C5
MGDAGGLFTDRRAALQAAQQFLGGDDGLRALVFTGVSGMGKSTLLERIAAQPLPGSHVGLLDAASLRVGMTVRSEGGEQAALELLRQVGAALAACAPWWRRRWVRQQAEAIGVPRPLSVRVRQWAGRGAAITNSPVTVTAGTVTQAERRAGWVRDLLTVTRAVRRRSCVLMIDTCEWLMYFDDVQTERPRPGEALGVGGWFANVLEQLLNQAPGLRVVLAGTAVPEAWREDTGSGRYKVHELIPWETADTRAYLSRRAIEGPDGLAAELTDRSQGLPAEISWIADALTGALLHSAASATPTPVIVDLGVCTENDRRQWLRTHVLARVSDRNQLFLHAAAVLGTFTPHALYAVANGPGTPPPTTGEWFAPLSRMSCLRELPHTQGQWQLHRSIQDWLLAALAEDDTHRIPGERTLPRLHERAAVYHEALACGEFSVEAAHHRFALGDARHVASWTEQMTHGLTADPVDGPYLQLLTDSALSALAIRDTLPVVYADAQLVRAYLAHFHGDHAAAYEHAEQALTTYREVDHASVRVAATLAGQVAWSRSRYADAVTHWTTALNIVRDDEPRSLDLVCALAEATVATGNFPQATQLLAEALSLSEAAEGGSPPPTEPRESTQPVALSEALPPLPLADAVPARLGRAHVHVLISEVTARLCEWSRSAHHADLALEHADGDPHITAQAHRLYAELAYYRYDLSAAEGHVRAGFTAARHCPDQRCMVLLQLTYADTAFLKAVWAPPTAVTPGSEGSSSGATSLSLTARAESAHQRTLAQNARATAALLASEIDDDATHAHSLVHDEPAKALEIYRVTGDRHGQANAWLRLTELAMGRGDLESADRHAAAALSLYRATGNQRGQAYTLQLMIQPARLQGDFQTAERYATEAIDLSRGIDFFGCEADCVINLADTARIRGDRLKSDQLAHEALAVYRTIGDQQGQANVMYLLAENAGLRDDLQAAELYATQSLVLCRSIGRAAGEASALASLAATARLQGDLHTAERRAVEALALSRSMGDRLGQAGALELLSATARRKGDLLTSDQYAAEAFSLFHAAGDPGGQANAVYSLAENARLRDDTHRARSLFGQAAALFNEAGRLSWVARCRAQQQEL